MAFDEDDLEILNETRDALYSGLDVTALVARGHHDRRRAHVGSAAPERPANRVVTQAQAAHEWQGSDKPVDQTAQTERAYRQQKALLALDRLEISERDQRTHICGGEYVLRRLRHLQPYRFCCFQQRVPHMGEVTDDETSFARAQAMQVLKHALAVVERAQRVDDQDDVERSGQS